MFLRLRVDTGRTPARRMSLPGPTLGPNDRPRTGPVRRMVGPPSPDSCHLFTRITETVKVKHPHEGILYRATLECTLRDPGSLRLVVTGLLTPQWEDDGRRGRYKVEITQSVPQVFCLRSLDTETLRLELVCNRSLE